MLRLGRDNGVFDAAEVSTEDLVAALIAIAERIRSGDPGALRSLARARHAAGLSARSTTVLVARLNVPSFVATLAVLLDSAARRSRAGPCCLAHNRRRGAAFPDARS